MSPLRTHTGLALPELLVAVLLLELAAVAAAAAFLTAARVDRLARDRTATDLARRDTVRARAAAADCRHAPHAEARTLALPGATGRQPLVLAIRCGR